MHSFTTVPGKLPYLFEKIRDVGVPRKVTTIWLESIGLKAKNDRTMIPVLKMLGFIDDSKTPTEVWKQYRGSGGNNILYSRIKEAYKKLFETFPDACRRDKKDIENFLRAHSDAGSQSIQKSASTFFKLCEIAGADKEDATLEGKEEINKIKPKDEYHSVEAKNNQLYNKRSVCININLQITLPETTDEKVYDSIFKAMKKNIMD